MDTPYLAEAVLDPGDVPVDRLYRVAPEVYRALIEHGLIAEGDGVGFEDGLLVNGVSASLDDRLYRLSLDLYDAMVGHGLLGPVDKVELLDGLLVKKMTKGHSHIVATHLTRDALAAVLPGGWFVFKEDPVALPTGPSGYASEPEPDVSVVRGVIRDYLARHPDPRDMALVVEVADSLVRDDRVIKLIRYAWASIPVAWLVNLVDRSVEVYSQPTGPAAPARYREVAVYGEGDDVPVVLDGREAGRVAARDLLP